MLTLLQYRKTIMIEEILIFLIVFLSPIMPAIYATGFLISIDFVTGVWGAHKKKEKISSRKMRDTLDKILVYNMGIIIAHLIENYMLEGWIPFIRVVLGFVAISELKSISENLHKITGIDVYKKAIKYLKKKHKDI